MIFCRPKEKKKKNTINWFVCAELRKSAANRLKYQQLNYLLKSSLIFKKQISHSLPESLSEHEHTLFRTWFSLFFSSMWNERSESRSERRGLWKCSGVIFSRAIVFNISNAAAEQITQIQRAFPMNSRNSFNSGR